MDKKNIKIAIITSKGGHLYQISRLKKFFKNYDHFWVTFNGEDVKQYLKKERVYYAFYPDSRNIINAIKNLFLAIKIFNKEQPTHLISSGAGIAVPFFLVGKFLFKAKTIYIEPFDFVSYPSLTGKILYNLVDLFLIQQKNQKKWYKKGKYWGGLI
ncbi:MAG: UDP-N-acetylglucosamine--LPS N-acetylglucosamine transferase [Candidatus Microgenomates bacterium]